MQPLRWTLFLHHSIQSLLWNLSQVENIFAAWRSVLKKMYLSRRMLCFNKNPQSRRSGIQVVWSMETTWNSLAFFFRCQSPFLKLGWLVKFQSYTILYNAELYMCWTMLSLILLSISWGCDVHSVFFVRFAVALLARAGRTWSAGVFVDWSCGRSLPMATYVISNPSDLSWPIEDGYGPSRGNSSLSLTIHLSIR